MKLAVEGTTLHSHGIIKIVTLALWHGRAAKAKGITYVRNQRGYIRNNKNN